MLRVSLKPSFFLSVGLAVVHLATAALLLPLELSISLRITGAAVIALSFARSMWLHALLRAQPSIIALSIEDRESCTLETRSGAILSSHIVGSTYVTPLLTVINAKPSGARFMRHIVILPDSITPEEYRQLRVLLRWARPAP